MTKMNYGNADRATRSPHTDRDYRWDTPHVERVMCGYCGTEIAKGSFKSVNKKLQKKREDPCPGCGVRIADAFKKSLEDEL